MLGLPVVETSAKETPMPTTNPRGGRPEIGPMINVRLPEDLIARVDARARSRSESRASCMRNLLRIALDQVEEIEENIFECERLNRKGQG